MKTRVPKWGDPHEKQGAKSRETLMKSREAFIKNKIPKQGNYYENWGAKSGGPS